jgi:predicted dehydrogenase
MNEKNFSVSRREFIQKSTVAGTSLMVLPSMILGREGHASPNEKLNLAVIGAGGRGKANINGCKSETYVAFCDVDDERAAEYYTRYEKVPKYKDYRVMLDKHEKEIDAVLVSTPDHTHAVIALNAIRRKKHVYVEKPLAHTIEEVRVLRKEALKHKIITQLGNQGHSYDDIRKTCEWVWEGALGQVREVQAWYQRPYGSGKPRPTDTPPVPDTLDWDLWLGPVAWRPYHSAYLPGSWRGWSAFGTGVLGDWVCHVLDPTFWALKLGAPTSVMAKNEGPAYSLDSFPLKSTIEWEFPAREGMDPVKVSWTYGKGILDHPSIEEAQLKEWRRSTGAVLIGEKGCILHGSHGAGEATIYPRTYGESVNDPKKIIPRVEEHHLDFIRACKEGKPAGSNFEYGGPLTEVALLGVIATVFDREKLLWDGEKMRFTNNDSANNLLRNNNRVGWSLYNG